MFGLDWNSVLFGASVIMIAAVLGDGVKVHKDQIKPMLWGAILMLVCSLLEISKGDPFIGSLAMAIAFFTLALSRASKLKEEINEQKNSLS